MPPAARFGDRTSHGTPLTPGPGCVTVLIGGQPAWRARADRHVCPEVTGEVPHVGGVVLVGSITVFINGMPAARLRDQIVEVGPPNEIVQGLPTVIIGD